MSGNNEKYFGEYAVFGSGIFSFSIDVMPNTEKSFANVISVSLLMSGKNLDGTSRVRQDILYLVNHIDPQKLDYFMPISCNSFDKIEFSSVMLRALGEEETPRAISKCVAILERLESEFKSFVSHGQAFGGYTNEFSFLKISGTFEKFDAEITEFMRTEANRRDFREF
jgi:hypothetical protein